MDSAVALTQAYLYANGYFTVTEYPVIEALRDGDYRSASDVDIIAVRFPGAGRLIPKEGEDDLAERLLIKPDPALALAEDRIDLLLCEVKEGPAMINRGAKNPAVVRAALARIGWIAADHASLIAKELRQKGEAETPCGARVRLVAFGSPPAKTSGRRYKVVPLAAMVDFLQRLTEQNWDVFRHAQFKDAAMGLLMVLEKARRHSD